MLSLPQLSNWDKSQYFTNDSVIVITCMWLTKKVDTTYVFTVIQDPISGYVVKYRKESWKPNVEMALGFISFFFML